MRQTGDPWERINKLDEERLEKLVLGEATEVAAVLMSKIDTANAAKVLARLPGDRARRISYAISMTAGVSPEAVDRIGLALAAQLDADPPKAFEKKHLAGSSLQAQWRQHHGDGHEVHICC